MNQSEKSSFRVGAAFLIGGIVLMLILRSVLGMWSPTGGGSGSFDSYRGPVLPLTAIGCDEALDTERRVNFDFSPYEAGEREIILTDAYRLTNPTSDPITAALAYPFQGALIDDARFFPTITAGGDAVETTLHLSLDAEGKLSQAEDWEAYKAAMLETDYLSEALAEFPTIDTPVTVYKIYDVQDHSTEDVPYKYLALTYTPDPGCAIWGYHCSDNENEDGTHFITLDVPQEDWQWGFCYLLVEGGELRDFSQQGHHSTFPQKESNRLDGISATIEQFDSTFGEMVQILAEHYRTAPMYDARFENNPYITADALCRGALARIGNGDYHEFSTVHRILSDVFGSVLSEEVLMYQVFSLTLAPGETVALDITYHQGASRDFGGFASATNGYDLATKLGSTLTLDTQSASVSGYDFITIAEQNFGFNVEAGIDAVPLDPAMERYYMKVKPIA